ncbi:MAG: hypothetical protein NTY19_05600, partial [Planctomycetota bacterium]|nr:hypothetical protein [Planctomycetota bacterium]
MSTPWPQATDYGEAIQNLPVHFRDPEIRAGQAVTDARGLPLVRTGNFAAVFEVNSSAASRKWAVRCLTRPVRDLEERYRQIAIHLEQQRQRLPFMVGFEYLSDGVLVGDRWYSFVRMEWVEGLRLDEFLADCLSKRNYQSTLNQLCGAWLHLSQWLRQAQVAHGDLQHGNVILVPVAENKGHDLILIDYDGMYVPALAATPPDEVGHPAYQHPQRLTKGGYGPEMDRFSHLLIYCTLRCLMVGGRELWDEFHDPDQLLISRRDLETPQESRVFRKLWRLPDPAVQTLVGQVILAAKAPLAQVPLLHQLVIDSKVVPLTEVQRRQVDQWMTPPTASPAHHVAAAAIGARPFRVDTGTNGPLADDRPASPPPAVPARDRDTARLDTSRGTERGSEQRLLTWIKAGTTPTDLYQLVGRPLYHRNRADLLNAARACNRPLHSLQNHADNALAERAIQLQTQVAEALVTFSDEQKWRDYDARLARQLGEQYATQFGRDVSRWQPANLERWLTAREVPQEQQDEVIKQMRAAGATKPPVPVATPTPKPADFRAKSFGFRRPEAPHGDQPEPRSATRPHDSSGQISRSSLPPQPSAQSSSEAPRRPGLPQRGGTTRLGPTPKNSER